MLESRSIPHPPRSDDRSGSASPQAELVDQLPYAVLVIAEDGEILFGNARAHDVLKTDRTELVGTSLSQFVRRGPPTERAHFPALGRAAHDGSESEARLSLLSRDGSVHRVAATSTPVAFGDRQASLLTLRRVPERTARTEAVSRTMALLDNAFHLGPAALLILRLRDGLVLEVSDRLTEQNGLVPSEVVGQTLDDLGLHVEQADWDDLARELLVEGEIQVREFQLRRSGAGCHPFLASARRIELDGEVGALVSLIDVRELADQVRAHTDEDSPVRSAVMTNLTHEVRTPLTSILGFTSVLREGVPEKYQRFVDLIDRSGRRLRLMLDALLDLAQLEGGALEVHRDLCALQGLLRDNARPFVDEAREKGLSVTFDLPDECVYVRVDSKLLGRVVKHLMGNAVKFTSDGQITVRGAADATTVSVTIADTGTGIEADAIDRMLEPFAQESEGHTRSHQGCGLGLTVSKRLLEHQGGGLEIESAKGEGTSVTLVLPRATDVP
jgi:PAS domain S-box-containing protein